MSRRRRRRRLRTIAIFVTVLGIVLVAIALVLSMIGMLPPTLDNEISFLYFAYWIIVGVLWAIVGMMPSRRKYPWVRSEKNIF